MAGAAKRARASWDKNPDASIVSRPGRVRQAPPATAPGRAGEDVGGDGLYPTASRHVSRVAAHCTGQQRMPPRTKIGAPKADAGAGVRLTSKWCTQGGNPGGPSWRPLG